MGQPTQLCSVSLIGTFGAMYLLGYPLDNISLMALTIAVGFVVDDAIVVIETIVRHVEDGMTPLAATLQGASEIGFTVVSLTLTPMMCALMVKGHEGRAKPPNLLSRGLERGFDAI